MAQLHYNLFEGRLVVRPERDEFARTFSMAPRLIRPKIPTIGERRTIIAKAKSGFSRFWWHSGIKQKGKPATPGYVQGGPIPPGRWKVRRPGSKHPDGGRLRLTWIPVGPVRGRTHIYIHGAGRRSEGCVGVVSKSKLNRIRDLIRDENGGYLHVIGGIRGESFVV